MIILMDSKYSYVNMINFFRVLDLRKKVFHLTHEVFYLRINELIDSKSIKIGSLFEKRGQKVRGVPLQTVL